MSGAVRIVDSSALTESDRRSLVRREAIPDADIRAGAADIVAQVASGGDEALGAYGRQFGGTLADGGLQVPDGDLDAALDTVDPEILAALRMAIANVEDVHRPQRPTNATVEPQHGVVVERVWTPLRAVGVYVPGGRALYPSSLIMGVVPARVAGVGRIVVATPATPDGTIDPIVLAAARMLEVDAIYAMGGAQAVGALAYGTETVERVDKIVGPGGPWVTAAKLAVYGACGVDLPAGPSEAAVVADGSADARIVAADVMCQAEHGSESAVVLITPSRALADEVIAEVEAVAPTLERGDVILAALADHGLALVTEDIDEALAFADAWAPEHLSVHTEAPRTAADAIPSAGSVFIGHWTPEAAGDYATGANHVLPTGGLARAYGPLSVEDFGSWRQIQTLTREGLETLAPTITALAGAEGFTAHARSVSVRLEGATA